MWKIIYSIVLCVSFNIMLELSDWTKQKSCITALQGKLILCIVQLSLTTLTRALFTLFEMLPESTLAKGVMGELKGT